MEILNSQNLIVQTVLSQLQVEMRHSGENPVLVLRLPAFPHRETQLLRGREGGVSVDRRKL